MLCNHCGNPMEEDGVFCVYCGKKYEPGIPAQYSPPQAAKPNANQQAGKTSNSQNAVVVFLLIAIVLVIAGGVFFMWHTMRDKNEKAADMPKQQNEIKESEKTIDPVSTASASVNPSPTPKASASPSPRQTEESAAPSTSADELIIGTWKRDNADSPWHEAVIKIEDFNGERMGTIVEINSENFSDSNVRLGEVKWQAIKNLADNTWTTEDLWILESRVWIDMYMTIDDSNPNILYMNRVDGQTNVSGSSQKWYRVE